MVFCSLAWSKWPLIRLRTSRIAVPRNRVSEPPDAAACTLTLTCTGYRLSVGYRVFSSGTRSLIREQTALSAQGQGQLFSKYGRHFNGAIYFVVRPPFLCIFLMSNQLLPCISPLNLARKVTSRDLYTNLVSPLNLARKGHLTWRHGCLGEKKTSPHKRSRRTGLSLCGKTVLVEHTCK